MLIEQTPPKLRTSNDRFCSPTRPPRPHRVSVTPDRDMQRRMSRLSGRFPPLPENQRVNSPRPSLCSPLFQSQSQEVFSVGRRKSSLTRDSSQTNSPASSRNKTIPVNPTHSIEIENMPTDFYISPMDWSKKNTIAFALQDGLTFINPKTMEISEAKNSPDDVVSVKFNPIGDKLFLGSDNGTATIYDIVLSEPTCEFELWDNSVLNADWKENILLAGGRDGQVAIIDLRDDDPVVVVEEAHMEEICTIKMHPESTMFATCSNDCVVKIWDQRNMSNGPVISYSEHEAAIRAAAWSPVANDIIVTGGGTADKKIKMWNTVTGETIKSIDTGSQVCNLFWSAEYNEIFATHGFSQNHLSLWKGTDLTPVASFHTHKQRVLYMSVSPDQSTIATAAPGDTMQIWKMFPSNSRCLSSTLLLIR